MSSSPGRWAERLRGLEDRLRARGLTGAQAFDTLWPALEAWSQGEEPSDRELGNALRGWPRPSGDDLLGLAYEQFFADLFKGLRGQFFTPPPIGRWLVHELDPRPGETVLDPTCGSGGLLLQAARPGVRLLGSDLDPRLVRLATINLRLAGATATIGRRDFFSAEPEPVDVVIANPPFSVVVDDPAVLARYSLSAGRTRALSDVLFAEALGRWVRPGGRAGVVWPWSLVANPSFEEARALLRRDFRIDAVAALPEGVFRPFGGAAGRACLVWATRRWPSEVEEDPPTRFARLDDPGYDVRSRRLRPSSTAELDRKLSGEGWSSLPAAAWAPVSGGEGLRVGDVASLRPQQKRRGGLRAELGDVDPLVGELVPRIVEDDGARRPSIEPGDVVLSRLRPNLGNVALAPPGPPCSGSGEWLVLRSERPRWLAHTLRTPAFRSSLPPTRGQTHPRVTADEVLDVRVRVPPPAVVDAVDHLSEILRETRRRATSRLLALQRAVDDHAGGRLDDDALAAVVAELSG